MEWTTTNITEKDLYTTFYKLLFFTIETNLNFESRKNINKGRNKRGGDFSYCL